MRGRVLLFSALAVLVSSFAGASTFTVTNTSNSGGGSFRSAIHEANATEGSDTIVFSAGMSGQTIAPTSSLPNLTDDGTTIDGDIDDDGDPDITLDGGSVTSSGLTVTSTATGTVIGGLAIVNCPGHGIEFASCTQSYSEVVGCYFGLDAADSTTARNGGDDIYIDSSSYITVGGTSAADRNVFATGEESSGAGVHVVDSSYVTIQRNHFGIRPSGDTVFADGNYGVWVEGSSNCTVGSSETNGNRFASVTHGVYLYGDADENTIAGNYFGLEADGDDWLAPIGTAVLLEGVTENEVDYGPGDNVVGGTSSSCKNVFANGRDFAGGLNQVGVMIYGPGAESNHIKSNLFATNADGDSRRPLYAGVVFGDGSGGNSIGGTALTAANYFYECWDYNISGRKVTGGAVVVENGVDANIIRYNEFWDLVNVYEGSTVTIRYNNFNGGGVRAESDDACGVRVWHNRFSGDITSCVEAEGDGVTLDLGDATEDPPADGGNEFDTDSTWFVRNLTPNDVKAENNDWGTTNAGAIEGRIYDHDDDPSYGVVDYVPYEGMSSLGRAVSITSAAALPTRGGGAEIVFTLSGPATVDAQVLNVAGRPVAVLATAKPTEAGLQRLVWNGMATTGLPAPAGTYLVRITAQDQSGAQSRALTRLNVRR